MLDSLNPVLQGKPYEEITTDDLCVFQHSFTKYFYLLRLYLAEVSRGAGV